MKNILVYVEAAEGKAKNVGLEILTPAKVAADGGKVTAVVIGKGVEEAAKQAMTYITQTFTQTLLLRLLKNTLPTLYLLELRLTERTLLPTLPLNLAQAV